MAARSIETGLEHIRNGEKSMKTTILKWRPDFENAADEFNKAAICFKVSKSYEQCRDCFLKAAECHKNAGAYFYSAKALDQCILICKEMDDLEGIFKMAKRAANMLHREGNPDSAIATLVKTAKILESQFPSDALLLYRHAAEIAGIQDNQRESAEYTSKVARIHVKLQEYDQAADAIRREIAIHQEFEASQAVGRLVVALVLVQLARDDLVAAEKAFKEWGNYCDPAEMQNLEMLLQAYDEEDKESALRALNDPFIKHMDVEYAILARDMRLPQGAALVQKKPIVENATDEYKRVRPQNDEYVPTEAFQAPFEKSAAQKSSSVEEELDEYAGGLC